MVALVPFVWPISTPFFPPFSPLLPLTLPLLRSPPTSLSILDPQEVAVKLESHKARHPQLLYESKLYRILQGGIGIPHIK